MPIVKAFKADTFRSDAIKFDTSKVGVWYFFGPETSIKCVKAANAPYWIADNVYAYDQTANVWYYGYARFSGDAYGDLVAYTQNPTYWKEFYKNNMIWWATGKNTAFDYTQDAITSATNSIKKPWATSNVYEFNFNF